MEERDMLRKLYKSMLQNSEEKVEQAEEKVDNGGCLYIIQTRESIRLEEDVYKIGKTQSMQQRMNKYPKGSSLHKTIRVSDRHMAEKLVLREFRQKFTRREDMGHEYFQGNLQEMMQIFDEFERIL